MLILFIINIFYNFHIYNKILLVFILIDLKMDKLNIKNSVSIQKMPQSII